MSALAGLLTLQSADTDDLVGEYQEAVLVRNAKGMNTGSSLFGLLSRLKVEPADNIEFNWWEREPVRRNFYAASAETAIATDVDVDDGAGGDVFQLLPEGSILRNDSTGELIRVTADGTTDNIAISRGFGGSTAAVITDNDLLTLITLAKDEGADPTRAMYEEPSLSQNYIQTFNASVNLTNAFKGSVLRTDIEGPLRERRSQALEKIANDIEFAYLFGAKDRVVGSTGYKHSTGGIVNVIDTAGLTANILDGNGGAGATLANFQTWLSSFMTVGSDSKLAFCGPKAYAAISNYANTAAAGFRIQNMESVFGMNITEVVTPFGVLSLCFHPLMKHSIAHNDWMVVVDLQHVVQKSFEPLFLEPNIQSNGQDSYLEQFRAKLGMKVKFPESHAYAFDLEKIIA